MIQIVMRHGQHPGVSNSEAFLSHQLEVANRLATNQFNSLSYEDRVKLVIAGTKSPTRAPTKPMIKPSWLGAFRWESGSRRRP